MTILVLGILVFMAVHSLALARGTRAALIDRVGVVVFRAGFSVGAVVGLGLIVWGFARYRADGLISVWTPPLWTRHLTITLMWFAFISLAAAAYPAVGRIRGWLRHPLLVALKIWALAHLLANGDAGGMLVFTAFLAWAVVDRIAVKKRGDQGAARANAFTRADAVVLAGGTLAYLLMMLVLHPLLIGVAVVGG